MIIIPIIMVVLFGLSPAVFLLYLMIIISRDTKTYPIKYPYSKEVNNES